MKRSRCLLVSLPLLAVSCVGVRSVGDKHSAHAEAFHLFGLTIPANDQEAAWERVPDGVEVTTVQTTPSDWTSVVGILTNLFGFSTTHITWTGAAPK